MDVDIHVHRTRAQRQSLPALRSALGEMSNRELWVVRWCFGKCI